ncbi:hypothetical protein NUACC21_33540 [Scytonema sp. NUACC21]
MNPLKWLFINQLKHSRLKQKFGGFTLLELLVGMILAFLIITPLMGLMINIMASDRQEQAKTNTEQEIKGALDYIARDLQQAVYIYDDDGIAAIRQQLPKYDEKDNYFPVLVFWKRHFIPGGLTVTGGSDDTFVYALVAYYMIKDNNSAWSGAARIGRFQISGGYGASQTDRDNTRDSGFQLFELKDSGDLKTKMNRWTKKSGETYDQQILPLVDYIDQTPIDSSTNQRPTCPDTSDPDTSYKLVPKYTGTGDAVATGNVNTRGFYVCVLANNANNVAAEVYLRGNALARLQNNNLNFSQNRESQRSYFPQASISVKGRGFLFTE